MDIFYPAPKCPLVRTKEINKHARSEIPQCAPTVMSWVRGLPDYLENSDKTSITFIIYYKDISYSIKRIKHSQEADANN